jgi:pyruvate-formate lyase
MNECVVESMTNGCAGRIAILRDRALAGQWGETGDRRAIYEATCQAYVREPRRVQLARVLEAVCDQQPIHLAPDELIIGKRTVFGYPEHEQAIAAGSAEPGYMIADYGRVLAEGFSGLIAACERRLATLDEANPDDLPALDTLRAMAISCQTVITLAERHAARAGELAATESDPVRRAELTELARICRKVPAQPAETFHEAVQALWLTHLGVYLECEDIAFSFGRMDQYLYPYYRAGLEAGSCTRAQAWELVACLWIKIYENVHGALGHVQTVTVGGITPDGADGVNDLTWIIQEVTRELGNIGPSVASRVHPDNPDEYLDYILETMHRGRYMPQVYNDEQMVPALVSHGVALEDARDYGLIGCHEPTICGRGYFRSASWAGYVCFPDWLEWALGNGRKLDADDLAALQRWRAGNLPGFEAPPEDGVMGLPTGAAASLQTFDDLWEALVAQMRADVRRHVIRANRGEVVKWTMMPRPLMSALTRDCIEQGRDFTEGGARYNMSGFEAFGIGTCVDSLCALRQFVYETGELTLGQFADILRDNWAGHDDLRRRVRLESPHWGNDDDRADELGVRLVKTLEEELTHYRNIRGGPFLLGLWSFWMHVGHGKFVAASADGRRHGETMGHSMDPTPGCGLAGPTAAIRSAAKLDTAKLANGGSLLLEFQPKLLGDEEGVRAVRALVRTYFHLGGIQLQLSAVTLEKLQAAVEHPEQYADLVVRVAGYSDYFVRQDAERQAYILEREKFAQM